jgi:hypothetical protein
VWLTDPDGRLAAGSGHDLGVFAVRWLPVTLSIGDGEIIAPLDPARSNAGYRLIVALE